MLPTSTTPLGGKSAKPTSPLDALLHRLARRAHDGKVRAWASALLQADAMYVQNARMTRSDEASAEQPDAAPAKTYELAAKELKRLRI